MMIHGHHRNVKEAHRSSSVNENGRIFHMEGEVVVLVLVSHACANIFLCGHERVKRLSGEALRASSCTKMHQRVEHSSPPLHVPYSLQCKFYSYSTRHRKGLVGGTDACRQKTHRTSCLMGLLGTQVLQSVSQRTHATPRHVC